MQPKGGHYLSPNFVDLYPVRFKVFICDANKPIPSEEPDKVIYFPSSFSMTTLNEEMKTTFALRSFQTRCWLESRPKINSDINLSEKEVINGSRKSSRDKDEDGDGDGVEERSSREEKEKENGEKENRFLTSDITDLMCSDWRLLRYVRTCCKCHGDSNPYFLPAFLSIQKSFLILSLTYLLTCMLTSIHKNN